MARDSLRRAAQELEAAGEAADPATSDRLSALAGQLRSQADREATPALGALARVDAKLREIASRTDDGAVEASVERARERVLSFLGTLDDRGMEQHGWGDGGEDT